LALAIAAVAAWKLFCGANYRAPKMARPEEKEEATAAAIMKGVEEVDTAEKEEASSSKLLWYFPMYAKRAGA